MAIREIQAKTLLSSVKQPDPWFGLRYNMNLYRGCQHHCIYCDSRSLCYGIDDFDGELLVKANAPELLRQELARKRIKGNIGTGSMNDPYMPAERSVRLMRRALEIIAEFRFPVHILTKSDLVLRDLDLLETINDTSTTVSFTITTADDDLARIIEPGAPPPSARYAAMAAIAERGIATGVLLMPVLPFIEDNPENITAIVSRAAKCGASHVVPAFGMTLRDRQRTHFYAQLDLHFPGMSDRYRRRFGDRYSASCDTAARLRLLFTELVERLGLSPCVAPYAPDKAQQLTLL